MRAAWYERGGPASEVLHPREREPAVNCPHRGVPDYVLI